MMAIRKFLKITMGPYLPGLGYRRPTSDGEFALWYMSWFPILQFPIRDVSDQRPGSLRLAAVPETCLVILVPHPIPGGRYGTVRSSLGMSNNLHSVLPPYALLPETELFAHFALFWGEKGTPMPKLVLPCAMNEIQNLRKHIQFLKDGVSDPQALRAALKF